MTATPAGWRHFLKTAAAITTASGFAVRTTFSMLRLLTTDCRSHRSLSIQRPSSAFATYSAQNWPGARNDFDLGQAIAHEFRHADRRNPAITVNELDRALLQSAGFDNVSVLGHSTLPRLTKPALARAIHWFTDHVLEHVVRELGNVTLTVAGFVGPGVDLAKLVADPNVNVIGPVGDLRRLYASHRVFIAPTRLASGIPR
ncbi:MAG: glycosyltransferase family 4 protein [Mesorhizobium sp.]